MAGKSGRAGLAEQAGILIDEDFLHIGRDRLQLLLKPFERGGQQGGMVDLAFKLERLHVSPQLGTARFVVNPLQRFIEAGAFLNLGLLDADLVLRIVGDDVPGAVRPDQGLEVCAHLMDFRRRKVDIIDELLGHMAADPRFVGIVPAVEALVMAIERRQLVDSLKHPGKDLLVGHIFDGLGPVAVKTSADENLQIQFIRFVQQDFDGIGTADLPFGKNIGFKINKDGYIQTYSRIPITKYVK